MDAPDNVARVTSLRSRPSFTPMGPRTPFRPNFDLPLPPSSVGSRASSPRVPSPAHTSPAILEPLVLPTVQETPIESPITPQELLPPAPPAYTVLPEEPSTSTNAPPPPPRLTVPEIRFEPQPIMWKALPLEAALWTFTSQELQQIVSRAIRSSAGESFIRLLTVENLDRVLPSELERLNTLKSALQSRYRFLVHRRSMLLQALVTSAQAPLVKDKDFKETSDSIMKLALQLSETTIECDRIVEDLVKISDHVVQITRLIDMHWASALAIALRKLNNSYGRRTTELQQARDRVVQLEAELEDAWKEAEDLAHEMDEFEADLGSDVEGEAVITTAEVVTVPMAPTSPRPQSLTVVPRLMNVDAIVPRAPLSPRTAQPTADIPADIIQQDDSQAHNEDTRSIRSEKSEKSPSLKSTRSQRSLKSTKSNRSHRSLRGDTRSQHVYAARKRSHRASQGSLRLPQGLGRKQSTSTSRPKTPVDGLHPPVPNIPLQFTSAPVPFHSAKASSTLLHWDSRSASPAALRRNSITSTDENNPPPTSFRAPANLDDINLNDDDHGIKEVPRTPKRASFDDMRRRQEIQDSPTTNVTSIWRNTDTPKTPAERLESLMRRNSSNKSTPYQKLRTLTKRYSLPFPLLASSKSPSTTRRLSDRS